MEENQEQETKQEEQESEIQTEGQEENLPDINLKTDDSDNLNKDIETKLEEAGFSLKEITQDIIKNGEITPELVEKIKEKVNPEYVDAHLGRIQAELKLAKTEAIEKAKVENAALTAMNTYIYDSVGGEDNFKAMSDVLKNSMTQNELKAINSLLASGNKEQVNIAMKAATNRYNTIKGKGTLMQGDNSGQKEPTFIPLNKEDFYKIMGTEKYKTDPVYAKSVDDRRNKTRKQDQAIFLPGTYFAKRGGKRFAL